MGESAPNRAPAQAAAEADLATILEAAAGSVGRASLAFGAGGVRARATARSGEEERLLTDLENCELYAGDPSVRQP
jgi:hypothetical protein